MIVLQPGRPWTEPYDKDDPRNYTEPRIYVADDQGDPDDNVLGRHRKVILRGTWTLRQYRRATPCGAQFTLIPGDDATWSIAPSALEVPDA